MGQFSSKNSDEVSDGKVLNVAAQEGRLDVCRMYLHKNNALACYRSPLGSTLVHAAAEGGSQDVLALVLATLQLTAFSNNHDPVQRLLDRTDADGMTALAVAAARGHRGCVNLLLDEGASLWPRDKLGRTCLHHAALQGNAGIVTNLLDEARADAEAALQQASDSHDGNSSCPEDSGNRPLTVTCHRFVNAVDAAGRCALHFAVFGSSVSAASNLGAMHALITAGSSLSPAATCDSLDAAVGGVPVNAGATPLHLAALKGDKPACVLLLTAYVTAAAGALPEVTGPADVSSPTSGSRRCRACCAGTEAAAAGPQCSCGALVSELNDPRLLPDAYGLTPHVVASRHHQDQPDLAQLLNPKTAIIEVLEGLPAGEGAAGPMPELAEPSSADRQQASGCLQHQQLLRAVAQAGVYLQHTEEERWRQQQQQQQQQALSGAVPVPAEQAQQQQQEPPRLLQKGMLSWQPGASMSAAATSASTSQHALESGPPAAMQHTRVSDGTDHTCLGSADGSCLNINSTPRRGDSTSGGHSSSRSSRSISRLSSDDPDLPASAAPLDCMGPAERAIWLAGGGRLSPTAIAPCATTSSACCCPSQEQPPPEPQTVHVLSPTGGLL